MVQELVQCWRVSIGEEARFTERAQQRNKHLLMPVQGCKVERRQTVACRLRRVGPAFEQRVANVDMTCCSGAVQRGDARLGA